MVKDVDADVVAAEMVVELVKDVLKVVAAVIFTRMVTATIWEKVATHQDKITILLIPSTRCWEEAQHVASGSHLNYKMGQI